MCFFSEAIAMGRNKILFSDANDVHNNNCCQGQKTDDKF